MRTVCRKPNSVGCRGTLPDATSHHLRQVTMSLSETFGLTTLESLMCGCPAVIPRCDVFNEIWDERVPKSWRYDVGAALASKRRQAFGVA